ncbi:lipase [Planotetraspora silvatica]|uniref:Lipase n=1 Tax=Planotetraspora silvatica TaxID=234614 RepID=A0A8J3UPJ5_9ACTN|nr:alpha/beta fold hydrolase [Planotetraspora silvatica]GII46034.1 lipase [Planotetraspora silvatica]
MKTLLNALLVAVAVMAPVTATVTPARADVVCDDWCQGAWAQQRANALPRTAFYDPPSPLRRAPAGTLIRQQPATGYTVPAGARVTRLLYHSRTAGGRDVAASAVVLVPSGTSPHGGWPVVVDAHGTSGMARDCAPSLMRDLYHGDQMARFLDRGYAVVAPDYAGLGTDGAHALGDKTAAADDVVYALQAARRAVPGLSRSWVLWGHSQGGAAALAVAERQVRHPVDGYRGAVVTSPAASLDKIAEHAATGPGLGAFIALIAAGAHVSDPGIDPRRLLTAEAVSRLETTRTGCLGVVSAVFGDLTGPDLVRPGYLTDPRFARFLETNSTGAQRVAGPVLLLQGQADTVIPAWMTDEVAETLRRSGSAVDYRTYPGLEHDTYPGQTVGIDDGAMPDILAWVANRFGHGIDAGSTAADANSASGPRRRSAG